MRNWLAGVLFVVALASWSAAQDANALLAKTLKAYQSLSGLRVKSTIVAEQRMGEAAMQQTIRHEAVYQRPNFLRVRWEEETQGGLMVVSDGKNLFTQVDALKQVKKEPAPKTLQAIVRSGNQRSPVVDDLSCFLGEDWKEKADSAKVVGKETLNKRPVTKVQLTLKGGGTQTLWIDTNGFIWKTQRRVERKHPGGGVVTLTITETYQEVTGNPKLPKNFFTFQLPKGFREVKEFEVPKAPPAPQR